MPRNTLAAPILPAAGPSETTVPALIRAPMLRPIPRPLYRSLRIRTFAMSPLGIDSSLFRVLSRRLAASPAATVPVMDRPARVVTETFLPASALGKTSHVRAIVSDAYVVVVSDRSTTHRVWICMQPECSAARGRAGRTAVTLSKVSGYPTPAPRHESSNDVHVGRSPGPAFNSGSKRLPWPL